MMSFISAVSLLIFGLEDLFQDKGEVLKPSAIAVSQSVNIYAFSIYFMKSETPNFSIYD